MTEGDVPPNTPVASHGPIAKVRALLRDQRVRFLLVGGINTIIGFLVFIGVDVTVGRVIDDLSNPTIGSVVTLAVSQVISVLVAFVLHRRFVFNVRGQLWLDLLRFQSVYVVTFVINLVALPLLVAIGIPRIAAQAAIVLVMTMVSYVAHRHFSFRRNTAAHSEDTENGADPPCQ